MFIPLGSFCSDEQSVKPRVVQYLIFVNLSVCVYQLCLYYDDITFMMRHGAVPQDIATVIDVIPFFPVILPNLLHPNLITSLFLHDARVMEGGLIHIIGNMLYLSAFGPNLEARIGHFRFLILYLFSGVTATLLYVMVHYDSTIPLIGASGAVGRCDGGALCCMSKVAHSMLVSYFHSLAACQCGTLTLDSHPSREHFSILPRFSCGLVSAHWWIWNGNLLHQNTSCVFLFKLNLRATETR